MLGIPAGGVPRQPVTVTVVIQQGKKEEEYKDWYHSGGHMWDAWQPTPAFWCPGQWDQETRRVQVVPPTQGFHLSLGRWLPVCLPALPQQWVVPGQHPQLQMHLLPGL